MYLNTITITKNNVELDDVEQLLFGGAMVSISPEIEENVVKSYEFLKEFSSDKVIYGVNTGFGPMAQIRIKDDEVTQLQYNIIRSHSAGAGTPIEPLYVKAALFARLCTFTQGFSGVNPELLQCFTNFINHDITPYVPSHGSVGASGDLVQLAHIALALIGEGEVFYKGKLHPTAEVMQKIGIKPFVLKIRDGLALTNGTSMMTGIGLVNLLYVKTAKCCISCFVNDK